MINPVPQSYGVYPGVYPGPNPNSMYPVMYENHTNPEAEQFRKKTLDEIQFKQAYVKVEFLQNTLNKYDKELTQVQKNVLNGELQNAQREFALLQQQLNSKYGVKN